MNFPHIHVITTCLLPLVVASSHAAATENKPPHGDFKALYSSVAPFDLNKDGKLEGAEKTSLAKAISTKTLKMNQPPKSPLGFSPPPGLLAEKLADVYSMLAPYDTDSNGTHSDAESSRIKADLDSGKVKLPIHPAGR